MNTKIEILTALKESNASLKDKQKVFEMVKGKTEEEINEMLLNEGPFVQTFAPIVGGFAAGHVAGRVIGNYLNRAAKNKQANCKRFKGDEQRICRIKYSIKAFQGAIALSNKLKTSCKGDKSCEAKHNKKIAELKNHLEKAKAGLKNKKPGFIHKHFTLDGSGGDY